MAAADPLPPLDFKVPRNVSPGKLAHTVLCVLADDAAVMLEALARDLGVRREEVYDAVASLKYHGLVDGTYADRTLTEKGRQLIRATVRGARV